MRRSGQPAPTDVATYGGLRVDTGSRQAYLDDRPVALAPKELDLLALLVRGAGDVVTRESIMEAIWDTSWVGASRTIDVHVATLRGKLGRPELIETVRGAGYRLARAAEPAGGAEA
jgi:DNA-binding response OmpR family regulator